MIWIRVEVRAVQGARTLNRLPMMDRIMIAATETTILDRQRLVQLAIRRRGKERVWYQLHALRAETTGFMMGEMDSVAMSWRWI